MSDKNCPKPLPVVRVEQFDGSHEHPVVQELRAENERLQAENAQASEMASEILRVRALDVPAFLDGLAARLEGWIDRTNPGQLTMSAADCRAMARKLRGEAWK